MQTRMEQFPATNPNPVLSAGKDGIVLYSNRAGEPLLHEWGVSIGEKLPIHIENIVNRVIYRNSSEKIEVELGKRVYLVAFHSLPEEEYVNIYGFDISDQKEIEEKLRESEKKYRNIVETANEVIWVCDTETKFTYVNKKMADMLGYSREEIIGRFAGDFTDEEGEVIAKQNLEKRRKCISDVHEFKLICKDGSPLWVLVSSKALFDDNGKFAGALSMYTDITE